jgi:predicted nucleic-acid-binding Zn-ribbon protein
MKKLACPKCGATAFELYIVEIPDFFKLGQEDRTLTYEMAKCKNCGWQSLPTEAEEIRKLVISVLRGKTPKEGFALAE